MEQINNEEIKISDNEEKLSKSNKRWKITGIVLGSLLAASILTASIVTPIVAMKNKPEVKKTYKIEFDTKGGSSVDTQSVEAGKKAIQPNSNQKDKWLEGWYENEDLSGDKFDFSQSIEKDTKLYAKWVDDVKPVVEYTVTFNANYKKPSGEIDEITTKIIQHHTTVPASMSREGHSLKGWYKETECKNVFEFNTSKIENDIILYAKWEPTTTEFKVSFDSNGGTNVQTITAKYNEPISKPTDPTKVGYDFGGWFTNIGLSNEYDFNSKVTTSFTLYAKWTAKTYTVSFETEGAKETIKTQNVKFNEKATAPNTPTKDGNIFIGWYSDSQKTNIFSFDTPITQNITLYAKWEVNKYTITYDTNGGTAVQPSTVEHGETIQKPTTTKTGYTCKKWYTDEQLINEYNFETKVTETFILYAKWEPNQLTVKFNTNGAVETINDQTISYDTTAKNPGTITKTGHKFVGWYSDESFTHPFSFTTHITTDITLYAKWEINTYTIVFESNGGTHIETITTEHGKKIAVPTAPTKVGSKFLNWCSDVELNNPYNFQTAITSPLTLYAKWEETPVAQIVISGATDKQEVDTATTSSEGITLSATISPTTAIQEIKWSYDVTDDQIKFDTTTHKVSAPKNTSGVINVKAEATDGSGISSTMQIRFYDSSIFTYTETGDAYNINLTSDTNYKTLVVPSTYNSKNVVGINTKDDSGSKGGFQNQTTIEEVYLPSTITVISQYAFKGNTNLKKIVLPDSVTTISDGCFRGCSSLTSVHFGKGFSEFKKTTSETGTIDSCKTAFENCPKITSFSVDTNNTSYTSVGGVLMTKDQTKIIKYPTGLTGAYTAPTTVTAINDWAFYESTVNKDLILTNVTTLGHGAFSKTKLLTTWEIPAGITTVPQECFSQSGLVGIKFNNVSEIQTSAFFSCKLKMIDFGSAITNIRDFAFRGNTELQTIIFGSGIQTIGRGAFGYLTYLESVDFTSATSLTSIGINAFEGCSKLKMLDLSKTKVTTIDSGSFNSCTVLNTVILPTTLTTIGSHVFYLCENISAITIPASVTTIGEYAFSGCKLTSLTFSAGVKTWSVYVNQASSSTSEYVADVTTSTDATTNATTYKTGKHEHTTATGKTEVFYNYQLQWKIKV